MNQSPNNFVIRSIVSLTVLILFSTAAPAFAQTVFIPTFRNFTYRGSVSVPDGGTIQLGSVGSSTEAANSSGVPGIGNIPGVSRAFKNRGIGREQQTGTLTAKAELIIMEELEAEHLAKAGYVPGQKAENADVIRQAEFLSKHIGKRARSSSNDR